jgi:GT2 family glycosyltransferase
MNEPEISVIMTIVDGGETLERCLGALAAQEGAGRMEVLIPFDASQPVGAEIRARYPAFHFIDLGRIGDDPRNPFEEHAFYDRRRAAGLKAARAPLVAILEDRGRPAPDWARAMITAHGANPDGVIGGAVDCAPTDLRRWAIFFVDFGRYQAPFDSDRPEYVTDTNICYKRSALDATEHLWRNAYQESEVNWALRDKGAGLLLTPAPVTVQHRGNVSLKRMIAERFHWGRVYGQQRARGAGPGARLKWIASAPLVPLVLYLRHLLRQRRLNRHVGKYLAATPFIALLLVFWSIGELVGYLERDAKAA